MLEKVYIDQSDVLRQSVLGRGGGGVVMIWDETYAQIRITMISTGQKTFHFEDQICLALSLWVPSSVVLNRVCEKALLFPLLHRKSPSNLAGRELNWYKDTKVQVSHSNQVSLDSGPLASSSRLISFLPTSTPEQRTIPWQKAGVLLQNPTAITKTWHFAKRIFSLEVSQTT